MFRTAKRVAQSEVFFGREQKLKWNGSEAEGLANERQAFILKNFYLPLSQKKNESRKCKRFGGNKLNSFHKCLRKIIFNRGSEKRKFNFNEISFANACYKLWEK